MNIFDRIKRKGAEHVLQPVKADFNRLPTLFKMGKWVTYKGKTGIVNDLSSFPRVGVMLTDAYGGDKEQISCELGELRIASLAQIPAMRRPSPEAGAGLGYF